MPRASRPTIRRPEKELAERKLAGQLANVPDTERAQAIAEALRNSRLEGAREARAAAADEGDWVVIAELPPAAREVLWLMCGDDDDRSLLEEPPGLRYAPHPTRQGMVWQLNYNSHFKSEVILQLLDLGLLVDERDHSGRLVRLTDRGARSWLAHGERIDRYYAVKNELAAERAAADEARRAEAAARNRLALLDGPPAADSWVKAHFLQHPDDPSGRLDNYVALAAVDGRAVVYPTDGEPVPGGHLEVGKTDWDCTWMDTLQFTEVLGRTSPPSLGERDGWLVRLKPRVYGEGERRGRMPKIGHEI